MLLIKDNYLNLIQNVLTIMDLRELNIKLTKESLRKETPRDVIIIQTIHTIDELTKVINKLVTSLRERYGYYAPRASRTEDVEKFLEAVEKKLKEDVGIDFTKQDLDSMTEISKEIRNIINLKDSQEKYLESLTNEICPKMAKVATSLIAARLIDHAGSLKHLAEIPSSTIQVLGAEKALFRHIKTGAKTPKFGVIFGHPEITKSPQDLKGKAARHLSNEISKAAKIDFFRVRI